MKTEFELVSGVVFVSGAVCRSVHLFIGPRPKDGLTASVSNENCTCTSMELHHSPRCCICNYVCSFLTIVFNDQSGQTFSSIHDSKNHKVSSCRILFKRSQVRVKSMTFYFEMQVFS